MIKLSTLIIITFGILFISTGGIESLSYGAPNLEEKLEKQWDRYEFARHSLLERIKSGNRTGTYQKISRKEWDSWLAVPPAYELTPEDLRRLKKDQAERIERQKRKDEETSVFDFEKIRRLPYRQKEKWITNFCSEFPKGGMLHIHPGATAQRDTAEALLYKYNPQLPISSILNTVEDPTSGDLLYPKEIARVEAMLPDQPFLNLSPENRSNYIDFMFLPPGVQPFDRFDAVFLFIRPVLSDWPQTEEAYLAFAKRAAEEKVSYVEFTTSIASSYLSQLTGVIDQIEKATGVTIHLNRAFVRTSSDSDLQSQVADLLTIQKDPHIVGIDLIGNETRATSLEAGQYVYGKVLSEVISGQSKLHRTMHSGELGDPVDPRDSLIMDAERLGHGVKLAYDPVAFEYAARHHTPIEINLSSNLRLGAASSLKTHPFLDELRLGLPVSLSTDDEGIFEIDINHECEIAIEGTDLNYTELREMALNSIRTSFAPESEKRQLLIQLEEALKRFEGGKIPA